MTTPPSFEPRFAELPELARVERGRAFDPRIERVGGDRVEALRRRREQVPAVVDPDLDLVGCATTSKLGSPKYSAATAGTSGSSSATTTRSTAGSMLTAPAVMPAPNPITSTLRAPLGNERRQMAEHALQAHVLRVRRRLRFAGVVVGQRAVRLRGDGDRRRETLADVDDVGVEAARRQEAAERDELRRQRLHRERGDRERYRRGSAGSEAAGAAALARCREQRERRSRAREDHELLRALAADRDDQHERRAERADDGAERVGRVEPADRAPRLRPGRHCGRERQRKARAPEQRRR